MNREELKRISEKAKKNKGINDALQGFVHDFSTRQVLGETKIHQVEQTVDRTVVEVQQTRAEVREYQQKVEECHYLMSQMQSEMLGMQEKMNLLEKKNFIFEDANKRVDIRLHRLDDFNKKFDARLHSLSSETKERAFSRLIADFSNDNSIDNSRTIENIECNFMPTLLKERDSKSPENILQEEWENILDFVDDEKINEKSEDESTKEQNFDDNSEKSDEKSENAREQTTDEKSSENAEDESFSTNVNNFNTEEVPHDIPSTSSDHISDDSSIENNDEKLKLQTISEHERSFLTSEPGPSVIKKCNNSLASVLKTRKNIENRSLARTYPEPKTMVNLRRQRAEVKALSERSPSSSESCSSPEFPLEITVHENDTENLSSVVPETLDAEVIQSTTFLTETSEPIELKEVDTIETPEVLNAEIKESHTPLVGNSIIYHSECRENHVKEQIATVNELESSLDLMIENFDNEEVKLLNILDVEESLVPYFEKAESLILESYVDPSLNIGSRASIGIILESFRFEPVEKIKALLTHVPLFNKPSVSIVEIFSEPPSCDMLKRIKYKGKPSVNTKIRNHDTPSSVSSSTIDSVDLTKLKPSSLFMLKDIISKELEEFELSDSNDLDIPISDTPDTLKKEESPEKKSKKKKKKKKKKKPSSDENQIQVSQGGVSDSIELKLCIGSEDLIEYKELKGDLGVLDNKKDRVYVLDITGSLQVESESSIKENNKNNIPQENNQIHQHDSTSLANINKISEEKSKQVFEHDNETLKSKVVEITPGDKLSEICINDESSIGDKKQEDQEREKSDEVGESESKNSEPETDTELQSNRLDFSTDNKTNDLIDLEILIKQNISDYIDSVFSIDVFNEIIGESEFSFTYIPEVNITSTSETLLFDNSELNHSDDTNLVNNRSLSVIELEYHNCDSEDIHKELEFMTPFGESSELLDSKEECDFMMSLIKESSEQLEDHNCDSEDVHKELEFMTPIEEISDLLDPKKDSNFMTTSIEESREQLENNNCDSDDVHKELEFTTPIEESREQSDSHKEGGFMTPLQDCDEAVDLHEDCDFMTPVQDIEEMVVDNSKIIQSDNKNLEKIKSTLVLDLKDHIADPESYMKGIKFMTPIEESNELLDSHEDGDFMTPMQDCDELVDPHEDCEFMTPVQDTGVMINSHGSYEYMQPVPAAYNPNEFQSADCYSENINYELYPDSYSSVYFGDWNSYTLEYSDEAFDYADGYETNENVTNDFCAVEQRNVSMVYSENEEYVTCSEECHDNETNNITEEITSIVEIKNTQKDVRFVAELEREMITQALEPNADQLSFEVKKYSYPIDTCEDSDDEKQVEKKDAESQADKFTFNNAQNASTDTKRLNEISPSKFPYNKSDPLKIIPFPIDTYNEVKKDSFTQTSEEDDVESDDITNNFCPQGEEIDEEEVSLYLQTTEGASSMDIEKSGEMEVLGVCTNCSEPAKLRCGNCRQEFYCKRECQRDHWKKSHKNQCCPYKVCSSSTLGRYMVATRDLKAGDIILKEDPIVVGPKQQTEPLCLGCYKRVDGSYRCEICSWPMCGPECCKSPDHQPECVVGREIGSPIQVNDFNSTNHFYEVIMPLRCLALKKRSPKKYEQFKALESHYEDRQGTFKHSENQKNVVEMLRGYFMLLTFDPDEIDHTERGIHSALGRCDTNALDISLTESTIQGLYPNFAMLEHSCTPNTKHTYVNGRKVVLKAAIDIKQGEHLSTMYTHILWGTYARREHLKHNKYFMCQCPRCSDPTELGTHFSALRCPRCPPGFLLPAAPLDELADWICTSCNFTMNAEDARAVTVGLGGAVEQALMEPTTDLLETIIENNAKNNVHPNHFHLFVIRHTLLQMYGRDPTTQDEESMKKKEKLCQDFLKICTALDPGMARLAPFAGVALYEYHLAVLSRARGEGTSQQVDQITLKKDLETAKALLQQCIKVLVDEPEDQPEGQLYKVAQQNLLELKQWEATVIEPQT